MVVFVESLDTAVVGGGIVRRGLFLRYPPRHKTSVFVQRTLITWLLDTRKEAKISIYMLMYILVCQGRTRISNDDVGVARGTVFQEIRRGADFTTGDTVKETFGGGLP